MVGCHFNSVDTRTAASNTHLPEYVNEAIRHVAVLEQLAHQWCEIVNHRLVRVGAGENHVKDLFLLQPLDETLSGEPFGANVEDEIFHQERWSWRRSGRYTRGRTELDVETLRL